MAKIEDELFQRLTLLNQYTILACVDGDNTDFWKKAADAIRSNLPLDELPNVYELQESASDPFTAVDRALVQDALELFGLLQTAEAGGNVRVEKPSLFPGFDGNHETKHMGFTRRLIEDDRYTFVKSAGKDFNSHAPMVEIYGRMVDAWKELGSPRVLNEEDYRKILNSRTHPSFR